MKAVMMAAVGVLLACRAVATQYSCLSIIREAKKIGKWSAIEAWIVRADLKAEWDKCSYVSDDDPAYATVTNALVTGGVMTEAEIRQLLDGSKDSAVPDALLRRAYESDMKTEKGRERWHGKCEFVIDTDKQVTTYRYADGYVHVEPFSVSRPRPVTSQLSDAAKRAKMEEQKRKAAERRNRIRQERIDLLTTNMTVEVKNLMKSRKWPEELAEMYLRNELNKLIGTNTVNAVVTPQKQENED